MGADAARRVGGAGPAARRRRVLDRRWELWRNARASSGALRRDRVLRPAEARVPAGRPPALARVAVPAPARASGRLPRKGRPRVPALDLGLPSQQSPAHHGRDREGRARGRSREDRATRRSPGDPERGPTAFVEPRSITMRLVPKPVSLPTGVTLPYVEQGDPGGIP